MKITARIANKSDVSFLDYPSNRKSCITYFLYGCNFSCEDCHNSSLRNCEADSVSTEYSVSEFVTLIHENDRNKNRSNGMVVLQGGDPLSTFNRNFTLNVLLDLYELNSYLKLCIYTGYNFNIAKGALGKFVPAKYSYNHFLSIIGSHLIFLKCGQYDKTQAQQSCKKDNKMYLASKNQEMYQYNNKSNIYECISSSGVLSLE